MTRYDKLVRDGIPDIIREKGGTPVYHIATRSEYERALTAKLREEVDEYLESGAAEELADILEVVYTLAASAGYSNEQLNALRDKKADERGGFTGRVILEEA